VDLTYDVIELGTGRAALAELAKMDHSDKAGTRGVMILGQGALTEADGAAVLGTAMAMCAASGSKLLVLHTAASRVGALDVGAVNDRGMEAVNAADVIFNLGADEVEIAPGAFVIYQGSHGDRGAHRADVILPGAAYTEETGLFVNTEGRPQLAMRAGFAPGEAKENWAIHRALSAKLGAALPWNTLAELRQALVKAHPHLGRIGEVPENGWQAEPAAKLGDADFRYALRDFYLTNPIARASELMAELSRAAKARTETALAAE
jgi:NADH-quinone oxidoreductase subunit G